MDVWIVLDDSPVAQHIIGVFAHEPSEAELDGLGPLRQDFSDRGEFQGQSLTTRVVERWTVQDG